MGNKIELQELSLLVWLSRGSKDKLIELMCRYTGCEPEVYTDRKLVDLMERAIIDISRKYHIKNLMYEYIDAKNRWQNYAFLFPNKYTYNEIDVVSSAILSITLKNFDEEDKVRIEELKTKIVKELAKVEKKDD